MPRWKMDAEGAEGVQKAQNGWHKAQKVCRTDADKTNNRQASLREEADDAEFPLPRVDQTHLLPYSGATAHLDGPWRACAWWCPLVEESRQKSSRTWMRCRDTAGEQVGMGNFSQQVGNLEFWCKQDRQGGGAQRVKSSF